MCVVIGDPGLLSCALCMHLQDETKREKVTALTLSQAMGYYWFHNFKFIIVFIIAFIVFLAVSSMHHDCAATHAAKPSADCASPDSLILLLTMQSGIDQLCVAFVDAGAHLPPDLRLVAAPVDH